MQEILSARYIPISINGTDALGHSQSFYYTYILTLPTLLQGHNKVNKYYMYFQKFGPKKLSEIKVLFFSTCIHT